MQKVVVRRAGSHLRWPPIMAGPYTAIPILPPTIEQYKNRVDQSEDVHVFKSGHFGCFRWGSSLASHKTHLRQSCALLVHTDRRFFHTTGEQPNNPVNAVRCTVNDMYRKDFTCGHVKYAGVCGSSHYDSALSLDASGRLRADWGGVQQLYYTGRGEHQTGENYLSVGSSLYLTTPLLLDDNHGTHMIRVEDEHDGNVYPGMKVCSPMELNPAKKYNTLNTYEDFARRCDPLYDLNDYTWEKFNWDRRTDELAKKKKIIEYMSPFAIYFFMKHPKIFAGITEGEDMNDAIAESERTFLANAYLDTRHSHLPTEFMRLCRQHPDIVETAVFLDMTIIRDGLYIGDLMSEYGNETPFVRVSYRPLTHKSVNGRMDVRVPSM